MIDELVVPVDGLKSLGSVLVVPKRMPSVRVVVWRNSNRRLSRLTWTGTVRPGNPLEFCARDLKGTWSAEASLDVGLAGSTVSQATGIAGDHLQVRFAPQGPVGDGVFDMSIDLVALPDTRTVMIRPAHLALVRSLTEAELTQRIREVGLGTSTVSDRVRRDVGVPQVALGTTRLKQGEYAIEVWSRPDDRGNVHLLRTKYATAIPGTLDVLVD